MAAHLICGLLLATAVASWPAPASAGNAPCAGVIPPAGSASAVQRPLLAEDLARLSDIGAHDIAFPDAGSVALSPDGSRMAFQVRQAVPEINDYCLAMVVMAVRPGANPVVIDRGGELIRSTFDFRGKAAFPSGAALPIAPRWSPDGTWLAYLKRAGSTTQVWRADAGGGRSAPITRSPVDVEDFRIGEDGRSIVFSSRPGLAVARRRAEIEGLSGYRFDDRYSPMAGSRPFAPVPIAVEVWSQAIDSGAVRRATDAEAGLLDGAAGLPNDVLDSARGTTGRKAWTLQSAEEAFKGRVRLFAEGADGRPLLCQDQACSDRVGKIWWTKDGKRVRFFRREGWSREISAIYQWRPGHGPPRRLYGTTDILADCTPRNDALVCLRESSTQPRRIVQLDLSSGVSAVLFDPNPEYGSLRLGHVERLRWRNVFGLETYGDVVFPVDYRRGRRYPLIIVQYESRGFLRGGTGDEYPIQAFANRGYVVLSFNRPQMIGSARGGGSAAEIEKENLGGFAERQSLLSAIEAGVAHLEKRGIIDRERIGITGLSDGTTTVQFALINGSPFSAASVSSGFWDRAYPMLVGPSAAREFAAMGYPGLTQEAPAFWQRFSVARNAHSIRVPILMQLADDGYLSGLESFTALREKGVPTDLFIFPGEHHVKWQPAHRLAIYQRNLDWFDYWLKGIRSGAPERAADLAHWDKLRREDLERRLE